MSRWLLCAASITMLAGGWNLPKASAESQDPLELPVSQASPILPAPPVSDPTMPPMPPIPFVAAAAPEEAAVTPPVTVNPTPVPAVVVPAVVVPAVVAPAVPPAPAAPVGYVRLDAPMYPSPQPNVPIWTGATMITNQAFAPHEMLYPHTYRAMYPPFYHRAKGSYFWTPFGYRSHERWDLLGTEVKVKYRSHWPIFGPHHPVISRWHGPWY